MIASPKQNIIAAKKRRRRKRKMKEGRQFDRAANPPKAGLVAVVNLLISFCVFCALLRPI
jgi:hypothetical protein